MTGYDALRESRRLDGSLRARQDQTHRRGSRAAAARDDHQSHPAAYARHGLLCFFLERQGPRAGRRERVVPPGLFFAGRRAGSARAALPASGSFHHRRRCHARRRNGCHRDHRGGGSAGRRGHATRRRAGSRSGIFERRTGTISLVARLNSTGSPDSLFSLPLPKRRH